MGSQHSSMTLNQHEGQAVESNNGNGKHKEDYVSDKV